jgi:hypothetical protein
MLKNDELFGCAAGGSTDSEQVQGNASLANPVRGF